tara:strand:- start:152 stop:520 length:369 start_codon:yes stop_codon:yes gene_type:complete
MFNLDVLNLVVAVDLLRQGLHQDLVQMDQEEMQHLIQLQELQYLMLVVAVGVILHLVLKLVELEEQVLLEELAEVLVDQALVVQEHLVHTAQQVQLILVVAVEVWVQQHHQAPYKLELVDQE